MVSRWECREHREQAFGSPALHERRVPLSAALLRSAPEGSCAGGFEGHPDPTGESAPALIPGVWRSDERHFRRQKPEGHIMPAGYRVPGDHPQDTLYPGDAERREHREPSTPQVRGLTERGSMGRCIRFSGAAIPGHG